jgi:hypothetical protein
MPLYCPQCSNPVEIGALKCIKCTAIFTDPNGWQPVAKSSGFPTAGAHLPLFAVNTVALMFWMDQLSHTPVTPFWYITLPFALALAAIPYLILVVVPGMCKPLVTVTLGAVASVLLTIFISSSAASSGDVRMWVALGFAAQLSLIPCAVYAVLKQFVGRMDEMERRQ